MPRRALALLARFRQRREGGQRRVQEPAEPDALALAQREADRSIMALIDRQYLARPFYGSRRMAACVMSGRNKATRAITAVRIAAILSTGNH